MVETIRFFDTTLRDGQQGPGLGVKEKGRLAIAIGLSYVGVDAIEIGFGANNAEFEMIREIAGLVGNKSYSPTGRIPQIFSLARALPDDVELAYKSIELVDPENRGLHVFIGTSQKMREHSVKKKMEDILDMVPARIEQARKLLKGKGVIEYSSEGATVTELDFLVETCQVAVNAGANIINVPDTTGYCHWKDYAKIIRTIKKEVTGIENVILSAHIHHDSGLSVATSLAGIEAGVRQVEGCVLQLGERAGNVDWMTVLADLVTMPRYRKKFDVSHIDSGNLWTLANLVSSVTHVPIPCNHPVIGLAAYTESSGIHVNGVLENETTYFEANPRSFGREIDIVPGQTCGVNTVEHFLARHGYGRVGEAYSMKKLRRLTDAVKGFSIDVEDSPNPTEMKLLADHYILGKPFKARIKLENFRFINSLNENPLIEVTVSVDGKVRRGTATGKGTIDCYMNAFHEALGIPEGTIQLPVWKENAYYYGMSAPGFKLLEKMPLGGEERRSLEINGSTSAGQEAIARSQVEISIMGDVFHGRASHTDITASSYFAIANAFDAAYRLGKHIDWVGGLTV